MPGHPRFARQYARVAGRLDEAGLADRRRALVSGLAGDVADVGAGHGLGFPHLPATVRRLVAVEPEPHLRRLARDAARTAPVPVVVVAGRAERLPLADASVDAAVVALVLCTVADPGVALAEVRRVLRPGGELRFLEHVRASTPGLAAVQRVLDATVWPLAVGGCHTARDTVGAIEAAGFRVDGLTRFRFPERGPAPTAPFVHGIARPA